ncbi:MAG: hypothetical protein LBI30_02550 [Holosporales bacterium]|nr:hypothetical protein [Holosporales bacterium]
MKMADEQNMSAALEDTWTEFKDRIAISEARINNQFPRELVTNENETYLRQYDVPKDMRLHNSNGQTTNPDKIGSYRRKLAPKLYGLGFTLNRFTDLDEFDYEVAKKQILNAMNNTADEVLVNALVEYVCCNGDNAAVWPANVMTVPYNFTGYGIDAGDTH